MSPLRKQMDEAMVVRGLAARTRESYLRALAGLAKHYGQRPDQIGEADVQRYLLYLIQERKRAWSTNFVGSLSPAKLALFDRALAFALSLTGPSPSEDA